MSDRREQPEDEASPFSVTTEAPLPEKSMSVRKRLKYLVPLLLVGVLLCTGASRLSMAKGAAHSGAHVSLANVPTRQQAIARVQPAVVEIIATDCKRKAFQFGTGEIIDQRGYIVTNYHVVSGKSLFGVLLFDNSSVLAQLTGIDPADDLAVLKITTTKHLSSIAIGNSSLLHAGDSVLAIGYPMPIAINLAETITDGATVTGGLISALARQAQGPTGAVITDAVQTDAGINPGNSGGALVDMQGQLIGIATLRLTYEDPSAKVVTPSNLPIIGIGFAIPANRVAFVTPQLIEYGQIVHSGHAVIKATLVSVTPELAELDNLSIDHGAYISGVTDGGPAAAAGLQEGDVIVKVNNTPITNAMEVTDALMSIDAGTTVTFDVIRGTQHMQVEVRTKELAIHAETAPVQSCSPSDTPVVGRG